MNREQTFTSTESPESTQEHDQLASESSALEEGGTRREKIGKAASLLETNRCLSTEHEAALHFAASLLSNPAGLPSHSSNENDAARKKLSTAAADSKTSLGVKDAWLALVENSQLDGSEQENAQKSLGIHNAESAFEYPLPKGQLAKSAKVVALATALRHSAEVARLLHSKRKHDAHLCVEALKYISQSQGSSSDASAVSVAETPDWFFQEFYGKVKDIRQYHAKHPSDQIIKDEMQYPNLYSIHEMTMGGSSNLDDASNVSNVAIKLHSKKRKLGNPIADGYDLYSILDVPLNKIKSGQVFSAEEVMGKYLDLLSCHQSFLDLSIHAKEKESEKVEKLSYSDFVTNLASGLSTSKLLDEKDKLAQRKKYVRFLNQLNAYLLDFLQRVSPLLDVEKDVVMPALKEFEMEWGNRGGVDGWECKPEEKVLAHCNSSSSSSSSSSSGVNHNDKSSLLDLQQYPSVEELMKSVPAETLKMELARLGMKCGGTPLERAKRLWCTRDKPLDELPAKLFTKKGKANDAASTEKRELQQYQGANLRRVDIARLEIIVSALLDQLRPTLDATARRAERRLTQTVNEKEREMEEEINGAYDDGNVEKGKDANDDSDDSEDEDAPIYNPKGVPLGWDGKPIPYWLFKLHGLNHFYPCEICGNESYRGRHNFEKHFAEAKHSYGMKCLGIPNTKHFHGVTKIEDAQNLWQKLQENVNKDIFDASKEEEYEDSLGNVLSRSTYEDLARQGLL